MARFFARRLVWKIVKIIAVVYLVAVLFMSFGKQFTRRSKQEISMEIEDSDKNKGESDIVRVVEQNDLQQEQKDNLVVGKESVANKDLHVLEEIHDNVDRKVCLSV